MINFRYHIVSLVAVFMALAVGMVLGATILGDRLNESIVTQAAMDRQEVQALRDELRQVKALDDYREAYAKKIGEHASTGVLAGQSVVLVSMPNAPAAVTDNLAAAVTGAGGTVSGSVDLNAAIFDPEQSEEVTSAVDEYRELFPDDSSLANKFGLVLSRALLADLAEAPDERSENIIETFRSAGLLSIDQEVTGRADLALVVTAPATPDDRPTPELLASHVQMDLALSTGGRGLVVAGPNSLDIDGTDVASVRAESSATDRLSTVDVADLSSGVTTSILALAEQLDGGHGHYGAALASRDGIAPELPVR